MRLSSALPSLLVVCAVCGLAAAGYALWPSVRIPPAAAAPQPTDSAVCSRALAGSATGWDAAPVFRDDVAAAAQRGLTPQACAEALALGPATVETPPATPRPAPVPPLARAVYDGRDPATPHPVVLRYRDLVVDIDTERGDGPPGRPLFTGYEHGWPIFSLALDEAVDWDSVAEVRWLDPASPQPQIVLTAYTGGAHCCSVTRIVTKAADGWHVVPAETLDGGYGFFDPDGGKAGVLVSRDNRFLYAFDCYACSYAPVVLQKLVGQHVTTVTRAPQYRDFLRRMLRTTQADGQDNQDYAGRPGYLAGWVAQKTLAGELQDGWRRLLLAYHPDPAAPFRECLTGAPVVECRGAPTYPAAFPPALVRFLIRTGYLSADQAFWLGKVPASRGPDDGSHGG